MALELSGTIAAILDEISGEGKNGPWRRREFILAYKDGEYDKKACFTLNGDKVDRLNNIMEGEPVMVKFNVESREYQDKWYTNLYAWYIKSLAGTDTENTGLPF